MTIQLEALLLALATAHGLKVEDYLEARFSCQKCGEHFTPNLNKDGNLVRNWWKQCNCHSSNGDSTAPRLGYINNIAFNPITGRYHVRKRIGNSVKKRSFALKTQASQFLSLLENRTSGVVAEEPSPLLYTVLADYIKRCEFNGLKATSIRYYAVKFEGLKSGLKNVRLNSINQAKIEAYVEVRRDAGCGNGTIKKELKVLTTIYTWEKLDPAWETPDLKHDPKDRKVYKLAQIQKLWSYLTTAQKAAVGLCLFCGLRAETAYQLQVEDIDGDEMDLPASKMKGRKDSRTALVPTLLEVLPTDGAPADKLITHTESQMQTALVAASKKAGINPPIFGIGHFRHHCSTWIGKAGRSINDIQLALDHTISGKTARYVHDHQIDRKREVLTVNEAYFLGTEEKAS